MVDNVTVVESVEVVDVSEVTQVITPVINEVTIQGEGQSDSIIVTEPDTDAITINEVTEVVPVTDATEVIQPAFSEVLIQVVEDSEMPYAKRVDFITGTEDLYRGEAAVGSLESELKWRIRKIFIAVDGDVTEKWANSNASFNKIWADRATYTYG